MASPPDLSLPLLISEHKSETVSEFWLFFVLTRRNIAQQSFCKHEKTDEEYIVDTDIGDNAMIGIKMWSDVICVVATGPGDRRQGESSCDSPVKAAPEKERGAYLYIN